MPPKRPRHRRSEPPATKPSVLHRPIFTTSNLPSSASFKSLSPSSIPPPSKLPGPPPDHLTSDISLPDILLAGCLDYQTASNTDGKAAIQPYCRKSARRSSSKAIRTAGLEALPVQPGQQSLVDDGLLFAPSPVRRLAQPFLRAHRQPDSQGRPRLLDGRRHIDGRTARLLGLRFRGRGRGTFRDGEQFGV